MRIAVINNMAPFIHGGAESLAQRLTIELRNEGHSADLIRLPLSWQNSEGVTRSMATAANVRIPNVDHVISLKFPVYYARNHDGENSIWLLHQFRQVYDQWNSDLGFPATDENVRLRELIVEADKLAFQTADRLYCNSEVTSDRMVRFNGIEPEVLLAPPVTDIEVLQSPKYRPYIFSFGRVSPAKRQLEAAQAMQFTKTGIQLVIAGKPETEEYHNSILRAISELDEPSRVTYIPRFVSEVEKRNYLSECLATYYAPIDEDSYGYVTLESAYAKKATVTGRDSGGIHALVTDGITGKTIDIEPKLLAKSFDNAYRNRNAWIEMGNLHFSKAHALDLSWARTVERLLQK